MEINTLNLLNMLQIKELNLKLTPQQLNRMLNEQMLIVRLPICDQNAIACRRDGLYIRKSDSEIEPAMGQCPEYNLQEGDWVSISVFTYEILEIAAVSSNNLFCWQVMMNKLMADINPENLEFTDEGNVRFKSEYF